mmetsp:Transcript_37129/g.98909  ORF Transcript_37129/g.98909 Transcript_37129/m.98909 type:complete len:94 (-) Transcript_37129:1666-1947(-)
MALDRDPQASWLTSQARFCLRSTTTLQSGAATGGSPAAREACAHCGDGVAVATAVVEGPPAAEECLPVPLPTTAAVEELPSAAILESSTQAVA